MSELIPVLSAEEIDLPVSDLATNEFLPIICHKL